MTTSDMALILTSCKDEWRFHTVIIQIENPEQGRWFISLKLNRLSGYGANETVPLPRSHETFELAHRRAREIRRLIIASWGGMDTIRVRIRP